MHGPEVETQPLLGGGEEGEGDGDERGKTRKNRGGRDVTAPDPELMDTATKFVQEIIEKAKVEAAIKIKEEKIVSNNCHSPTQPQLELELDLIMCRNPPTHRNF
jgi:hypothetical protein